MALDINDLLSKLSGVKQSSGREHWMARCPVPSHNDHNPSLSITQAPDKILLHCFGGCSQDDVLEAMGLKRSDLCDKTSPTWRESAIEVPSQSKAPLKSDLSRSNSNNLQTLSGAQIEPKSVIVDIYPYYDDKGNLIYERVRYEPKKFPQRRPDGKGGWIWNLQGVEPVLYRLPELIQAAKEDKTIHFCEGEKDVETLELLGYVATTSGPVDSWKSEFAEYFRDAQVILIPDNDKVGREFMAQVAKDLLPVVKSLKVLTLPGLAEKEDVSDWFEKGHTKEEFEELLKTDHLKEITCKADIENLLGSEETKPKVERLSDLEVDFKKLFSKDTIRREFLLEPWISTGSQIALFSTPKQGKSLLALDIAVTLATGRAGLGMDAREPISVLYLDLENTEQDLLERLESMGLGEGDDLSNLHYFSPGMGIPPLDSKEGGEWMSRVIEEIQPQLVIIDTMARAVDGEENSADTYRRYYRHVGLLLKSKKIAMLRLDHSGKDASKGQRGSSDKAGDVDAVYKLEQSFDSKTITLTCTHKRISWLAPEVKYRKLDEPLRHVPDAQPFTQAGIDLANVLDELEVSLDASRPEIIDALKKATGKGKRAETILEAQRIRRDRVNREGKKAFKDREQVPEQGIGNHAEHPREQLGTSSQKILSTSNNTMGTHSGTVGNTLGNNPATPIRGAEYPCALDLDKSKSTDLDSLRKVEEPTLALEPMKQDNETQPESELSSLQNTQYSTCKQCDHELLAPKSQTSGLCKRCELANQDSSDAHSISSAEGKPGNDSANDESTSAGIIEKIDIHKPDGSPIYDDSYFLDDEAEPRDLSDSELPEDRPNYGDNKLLKTHSDGSPLHGDGDIDRFESCE